MRRSFSSGWVVPLLLAAQAPCTGAEPAPRPNVLLVLADDED